MAFILSLYYHMSIDLTINFFIVPIIYFYFLKLFLLPF